MTFLKILGYFILVAWFPGYILARSLRIVIEERFATFICLPFYLGIPLTTLVYFATRMLHVDQGIVLFPLTCLLVSLVLWVKKGWPRLPLAVSRNGIRDFAIFTVLFLLILGFFYSYTFVRTYHDNKGGFVVGDDAYNDNIWSVSVSSEVKHHVPPRLPLMAGYRLRYHYLGDLFTDLIYRLTGSRANMLEFNFKIMPPFYLFLIFSAVYLSLTQCFRSSTVAFLGIGLLVFAPVRTSLFFKHHDTLAMIYFYVAVFYMLSAYGRRKQSSWGYLVCAFFLIGILPMHDAVFGVTVNGAIFLYAVVESLRSKQVTPLLKGSLGGIFFGALLYICALGWPAYHVAAFFFGKGPLMTAARQHFKPYTKVLKLIFYSIPGSQTWTGYILIQLVMGVAHTFFLLLSTARPTGMSLAYTLLGFPLCIAILRHPKHYERAWSVLTWVVMACIIMPAFVGYKKGPAEGLATMRALEFAQILLIPFTALAVQYLWAKRALFGKIVLMILFLFYVFPKYRDEGFYLKSFYYSYLDRESMQVLDFLREKTPTSSIVLHPFHHNPIYEVGKNPDKPNWIFEDHYYYISALGERQAVLEGASTSTTYFMGDASPEEVIRRKRDVDQFYETQDRAWAEGFLERLHVDYVWVPREKILRFDRKDLLTPVLENDRHILYRVAWLVAPPHVPT